MRAPTPLGSLGRGFIAGTVGAGVQTLFFQATASVMPKPPKDAFQPPESEQNSEMGPETIARRVVEKLMVRGPLGKEQKQRLGGLVHFGFGGAWGGLYGLIRETFPNFVTPLRATFGYGTIIWLTSTTGILPAFKLAGPPHKYPAKSHVYFWGANVIFAAALCAAYEALRPRSLLQIAGAVWSVRAQRRLSRRLPKSLRPRARQVVKAVAPFINWRPNIRGAVEALR
jgi:hypothetical protein